MKYNHIITIFAILAIFFVHPTDACAQSDPLSYLKLQCPQLTEKYKTELENCHAHYVMAVDVSLSMCKYETQVLPALRSFITALPVGDRITLIPFAKTANDNKMGFDVDITNETKASLLQVIGNLYPQGAEKKDAQYKDTDIYEAQQAIARSIQQNAQYEVDIVIFITDMMHCPANNIDRQFDQNEVKQMKTMLKSAKPDSEVRLFALELPRSGKPEGYVLPVLKDIYRECWSEKLEEVQVPDNSEALIGQWFEQQKNRIMFTKLQAIIISENKANPIVAKTHVDIDGNVEADVKWTASKLYPKITLDTTYVAKGSSFIFKGNKKYVGLSAVGELNEEGIKLGKIRNKSIFFHQLADTLHFDVSLPVPYQNEIDKLLEGRPGPVANSTEYKNRLIWTFCLPLWLSATILALILLYILLVIKAAARNTKVSFNGKISVDDINGDTVIPAQKVSDAKSLVVGAGGTNRFVVQGAWAVSIRKVTPSPLFFWKKAYFNWAKGNGYVATQGVRPKITGSLGPGNSKVVLFGGPGKGDYTHKITIYYTSNK